MLHSLLVLFRLFQFSWLLLALDFCKYGPGKSWKSPGILMDLWCTNPGMRGVCSIFVDAKPWEINRHFLKPSLVSTQNDVWATTEESPYCWRVTYEIWALLTGWSKLSPWHNQSEALPKPLMRHHYGISGALSSDVIRWGNQGWRCKRAAVFSGYFPSLVVIAILFFGHIHICVRFPKGLTSLIACSETWGLSGSGM